MDQHQSTTCGKYPSSPSHFRESVVNRIAAGEIIIRPANAIKELLENCIDAGATSVKITKADLGILCERFTTSKIRKFDDLSSLRTYGFRGEALASISHIAHLTIATKTRSEGVGWNWQYVCPNPEDCHVGRRYVYNVPQRRKALQSASDEYRKILDVVTSPLRKSLEITYYQFFQKAAPYIYISLEIAPDRVDPNVHPNKKEVHFLDQDEIIERIGDKLNVFLAGSNSSRSYNVQTLLPMAPPDDQVLKSSQADSSQQKNSKSTKILPQKLVRTDHRSRTLQSMLRRPTGTSGDDLTPSESTLRIYPIHRRLYAIVTPAHKLLSPQATLCSTFGSFDRIQLKPPVPVKTLVTLAVESEPSEYLDKIGRIEAVTLTSKAEMLNEYFSFQIDPSSGNWSLFPLLLPEHAPNMEKLPLFLVRAAVDRLPLESMSDEQKQTIEEEKRATETGHLPAMKRYLAPPSDLKDDVKQVTSLPELYKRFYTFTLRNLPPLGFDTAGKDAFQGKPLNEVHMITQKSAKGFRPNIKVRIRRYFLLDHDPLHDENDPVDQKESIWLWRSLLLIPGMRFGSSAKKNVHKVKLPELGEEFRAIERKASKIFSENGYPFQVNKGENFIEYKIPNWGKEWFRLGAMQNRPWRPVKNVEPYESRFYRIEPAIDRLMEFRRNVADLEAMVQDNPAFKDYVVQYWELNDGRRVALRHKYDSKETLFTALLARDEDTPVYFGLLLGDTFTDEGMHLTMRSKNLDALVVKSADEVEKLYSNTQSAPHEVWDTVASHRLVDHNDVIKLLEELVETPQSAPRVDPIRLNAPASHGVERLKTLLRQFKESINGENCDSI
ncbi:hypothetical protein H4Q26_010496 [Puccinia striiformis f. sp. tritici PST-130]|nr:hypothetical protein H4Q26_010496 [Puccinia striiformis f. sp. tritici PST-130]